MFSGCLQDFSRVFSGCSDGSCGPGGIWWSFHMKAGTLMIQFDDPQLFDDQLEVWTLINQKSTVIPPSLMVLFDVGGMFCEDCWCWWIFLSSFIWCWWNVFVTCAHLQKRIDRICPKKHRPRVRPALFYDLDLCRLEPPVQDKSGTFWRQLGGEQRLTDYRGRQECRLAQVHWFLWYPFCNTYHWYNFWMVKL